MFLEVANHLWQSTLFVAAVAVLCFFLRRDGAQVRYWLWWIASIKFLVPFSVLTAIGRMIAGDSAVGFVPEIWTMTAEVVAKPFATTGLAWSPGAILLGLWAVGSIALLARWVSAAQRLSAILATAEPDDEPLEHQSQRIRVYRSSERIEPGIVGVLRPALLLPKGIEQRLSRAQLDAVLTHEICHIERRDNLTAAVHMLVETVFWFHPIVWWIGARLIDERERACDEMVVAMGHDRKIYAESILDVCEHYTATPLRCAAGISGSDLKLRIKQIMRYQGMNNLKLVKKVLLGIAAIATLALPILAGLSVQQTALAQGNAPVPAISDPANELAEGNEMLPIVKVAPIYPPRAVARGIEGHVVVQFTVNAEGSTEDIVVVESSSMLFDQSAVDSVAKYKYRPRLENGTAVPVPGVQVKIAYELAGDPAADALAE